MLFITVCFASLTLNAKVYIIGVEDVNYYPWYDFSRDDVNRKSFTQELLSTFFTRHGYQFKFLPLPVKRFNNWYSQDGIDFKFPDNVRWRNNSRILTIHFSLPVVTLMAGTYVLKKHADMPRQNISRLGTVLGFDLTLWNDRVAAKTLTVVEETASISLVKHLLHGNIDGINIDRNVINYNLGLLNKAPSEIVLNKNIRHEIFAYHFSSVRYPQIIEKFNLFLTNNAALVAKLKQKYGIVDAVYQ